jgi:CheY-like chemotaxis protein
MPEMDGLRRQRFASAKGNSKPTTPIIAMTANAMQGDREKCLVAGMDISRKPVKLEHLEAMSPDGFRAGQHPMNRRNRVVKNKNRFRLCRFSGVGRFAPT